MLFNSPLQFLVLALLLVIGWLLGFASHSGGRRWRTAYDREKAERAQDRADRDARLGERDERIAALERDNATLTTRNAELERTRDRGVAAPALAGAAAASAARPAFGEGAGAAPAPARRGWFDWARGDDLTRLRGIDGALARRLKAERVERYRDLATLSDQDELALERRLDLPAGYIQREQWREQAQLLSGSEAAEHGRRFG